MTPATIDTLPLESPGETPSVPPGKKPRRVLRGIALTLLLIATGLIYVFANPWPAGHFDYQLRIADAFLDGHLGIPQPPPWLNEMVASPRVAGEWYSVFPLGSVLSMLPFALFKRAFRPHHFPDESICWVVGALGAGIAFSFFRLSGRGKSPLLRRLALTAFALFGTWLLPNLTYGGAWDLALGFAVLGQVAALCYALGERRRPLLAGFWFAVAFGNRTEVLLTAPLFLYLLGIPATGETEVPRRRRWLALLRFLAVPALLGVLTLAYNYGRFGSITDFGYARIPGVLQETWYRQGIVSLLAIPVNLHAMLLEAAWRVQDHPPYFLPDPMGGSIFSSSPYLMLLFRDSRRPRLLSTVCWLAVGLLTTALWLHGNKGGWQFSYRYGLVLLPWLFLLLHEKLPRRVGPIEGILLALSVGINAFATYLFYWTKDVHV